MKMRALAFMVAMTAAMLVPGTATAHNPSASVACEDGQPTLLVDLQAYNGTNHVKVKVDGQTIVDQDFGSSYTLTTTVGSPYSAHDVKVTVLAHDDPAATRGWSVTYDLHAPACKERQERVHPRAWLDGPCGDPMYRAVFDNRRSDVAVRFTFRYKAWATHDFVTVSRTVSPHALVKTGYRHVLGSSRMWVRALGDTLIRERSAPGGNYAACRR